MANFNGLIGLEQLAPEVREFIQKMIDDAIANSGGGIKPPKPDVGDALIKGTVVTSAQRPANDPNVWLQVTDGSIKGTLTSSKIVVDETLDVPVSPGDVFVQIEKE